MKMYRNINKESFEFEALDNKPMLYVVQYFYVAEICDHLNPSSDFPGQGFETFEKYYETKERHQYYYIKKIDLNRTHCVLINLILDSLKLLA